MADHLGTPRARPGKDDAPGRRAGEAYECVETGRLENLAHRVHAVPRTTVAPPRRQLAGRLEEGLTKSQVGVHRARSHRPSRGLGDETTRQ